MMRFPVLFIVLLMVAGCGGADSTETSTSDPPGNASREEQSPRMVDGVQVVEIEAGAGGFTPASVRLRSGVPVRLVFNRTTEADCLDRVSVPEFGVENVPLPMNEDTAVEFMPEEGGEFTFVCGMGMQSGTLVVST